eukprot:scaffold2423_cov113-Isochrysis_galbana.AAC.5
MAARMPTAPDEMEERLQIRQATGHRRQSTSGAASHRPAGRCRQRRRSVEAADRKCHTTPRTRDASSLPSLVPCSEPPRAPSITQGSRRRTRATQGLPLRCVAPLGAHEDGTREATMPTARRAQELTTPARQEAHAQGAAAIYASRDAAPAVAGPPGRGG